jgi:hypothetical protein
MELAEAREDFPGKTILPYFPSNLTESAEEEVRGFLRELKAAAGDKEPFMLQVSEDLADGQWMRILPIIASEML